MGSLNTDGSHISQDKKSCKKRQRDVIVTDYSTDLRTKRIQEFDPSQLDLALWLDASDSSKFTIDHLGNITGWEANVGGVTFTSDLAWAPKASKLNGLHCPLFNGGGVLSDISAGPTEGGMEVGSNPLGPVFTMLCASKNKDANGGTIFALSRVGDSSSLAGLAMLPSISAWIVQIGGQSLVGGAIVNTSQSVISAVVEKGTSRDLWLHGNYQATTTATKNKSGLDSMSLGVLTVRSEGSPFLFSGWIGEVIVINKDLTATDADRKVFDSLHRYLANKWGGDSILSQNML